MDLSSRLEYVNGIIMDNVTIDALVDGFVELVNNRPHELIRKRDVPVSLWRAVDDQDDATPPYTDWNIVKSDNATAVEMLQARIGRPFPPSFRSLLARYSFPALDCGLIFFFANTGQDNNEWELSKRLFSDRYMSPVLLDAGYIQVGEPYPYNYDPICFAPRNGANEPLLVQLDHEAALQFGKIDVVREIAPSFMDVLVRLVNGGEMPARIGSP